MTIFYSDGYSTPDKAENWRQGHRQFYSQAACATRDPLTFAFLGIVHRDVKTAAIAVDEQEDAVALGFLSQLHGIRAAVHRFTIDLLDDVAFPQADRRGLGGIGGFLDVRHHRALNIRGEPQLPARGHVDITDLHAIE